MLSFVAGGLSILSPCVLPLLPIVLGAAASEQKWGPAALAAGLSVSFVAIGLFVATIGFSIGLDADVFRYVAAVLMSPSASCWCCRACRPARGRGRADRQLGGQRFDGLRVGGLPGQFGIGVLLGAVWSPCVGPTLGAASLLAAQGRDLGEVGARHVRLRRRRCAASARARPPLPRSHDAVAPSARGGRPRHEGGAPARSSWP